MGVTPVAPGEVAAVVTRLEMRETPAPGPPIRSALAIKHWRSPPLAEYRALFRRVGAPWLWYSRLAKNDETVSAILADPLVEVHTALSSGERVGFFEYDFREAGVAQILFLGLAPELAGRGYGRWLMAEALAIGWRAGIERLTVQTCTLDHPAALPAYLRAGFTAVGRAFESFPDPRPLGILDRGDAPQVPLVRPVAS